MIDSDPWNICWREFHSLILDIWYNFAFIHEATDNKISRGL